MKQYIYSYEKVGCSLSGWGLNGNAWEMDDYRSVIDQKAKAGWRYVGFLPARQRGTGHMDEIDLIFEKEI